MKFYRLLWMTLILVSLAAGAAVLDWYDRHKESPDLIGRSLIGPVNLESAGIVLIETPTSQVTLRRTVYGWVVEEYDGFAADVTRIRALLERLAHTPIAQKVPMRADHLDELGLLRKVENNWKFEPGRTASVFSVLHGLDAQHKLMYQVLIGNARKAGAGTYVRFPVSSMAYLIRERLVLDGNPEHWIAHRIFAPDALASLRRVRIRRPGVAPLVLSRPAEDQPWRLEGSAHAPAAAKVQGLLETLATLRLVGVSAQGAARPAAAEGPALEVRFDDGRVVRLTLRGAGAGSGAQRGATLVARLAGTAPDPGARWRVDAFNRRFAGRVVALDPVQTQRLLVRREALLAGP